MSRPRVDTRRRCAERPGRWVLWRVFLALAALALGAASARAEVLVSNLNQDAGTRCSVPGNNPLQDAAGNEVAALSDQAESNLTQGPPQPKPLMVRFLEGSVSATHDGINAFQIEFSEEPENAVCTGVVWPPDDEPLSNPSGGALTPLGRTYSGSSKVTNSPRGLHQQSPPDLPVNP